MEKMRNSSTCRISDILNTFSLPIDIQLVDQQSPYDIEQGCFVSGDTFTIICQVTLHKVAAHFCNSRKKHDQIAQVTDSASMEILIPLLYNGKMKVRNEIRMYDTVQELCRDFPRYAVASEDLVVSSDEGKAIVIQVGTVVELDRIIPGKKIHFKSEPNMLVMRHTYRGKIEEVYAPVTAKGKFHSIPDETEYTIKEAIERYNLPKLVSFVDNEIQSVYTGLLKHETVSDTLQLNHLITQHVLVGHYQPVGGEATKNSEVYQKQGTLVVFPLEDPHIRNIEVKVVNQSRLNAGNGSIELQYLDSCLYVDFAYTSGIKRITGYTLGDDAVGISYQFQQNLSNKRTRRMPPEIPPTPRDVPMPRPTIARYSIYSKCYTTKNRLASNEMKDYNDCYEAVAFTNIDKNITYNEEILESASDDKKLVMLEKSTTTFDPSAHPLNVAGQPMVEVRPMEITGNTIKACAANIKRFDTLTVDEVIERLNVCGMNDFAQICAKKRIDGHYISKLTANDLQQKPFILTRFQTIKLEKIKDNWIPN